MIDWHGALVRFRHLTVCIADEERAQAWGRAALFREERDRLPHPGWLRTEPYTRHDRERVKEEHPDWFVERLAPMWGRVDQKERKHAA